MTKDAPQLLLFNEAAPVSSRLSGLKWPSASRFPLNIPPDRTVESVIVEDLRRSRDPLLVTGYASLDHVIELVAHEAIAAAGKGSGPTVDRIRRIREIFHPTYRGKGIDWNTVAEKWLDLIRPVWYTRLTNPRRKRPLRLRDIRTDLLNESKLDFDSVCSEFERIEALPPLDERVASCILGIGDGAGAPQR